MDKGSKKVATFLVSLCDLHQRGRRLLCSHDIQTGTNYCLDHEASASVGPHQMILMGKKTLALCTTGNRKHTGLATWLYPLICQNKCHYQY